MEPARVLLLPAVGVPDGEHTAPGTEGSLVAECALPARDPARDPVRDPARDSASMDIGALK